jgi:hypothetical protein
MYPLYNVTRVKKGISTILQIENVNIKGQSSNQSGLHPNTSLQSAHAVSLLFPQLLPKGRVNV